MDHEAGDSRLQPGLRRESRTTLKRNQTGPETSNDFQLRPQARPLDVAACCAGDGCVHVPLRARASVGRFCQRERREPPEAPPAPRRPPAADGATTTTGGGEVDGTTQAYLDSLAGFQTTLSNLQTELASANAGWDANPKTITFDQAEEAFIAVAEGSAALVGEVQAATVPAALVEAHNVVIAAAQQAADAGGRALAGLRAPSPDTGEARRAAVNEFDAAVTAFNEAVQAANAAAAA